MKKELWLIVDKKTKLHIWFSDVEIFIRIDVNKESSVPFKKENLHYLGEHADKFKKLADLVPFYTIYNDEIQKEIDTLKLKEGKPNIW